MSWRELTHQELACVARGWKLIRGSITVGYDYGRDVPVIETLNIPMRADRTLLADMLRHGRHVNGGERYRRVNLRVGKAKRDAVFQSERLVGELLGIEIEYYPDGSKRVAVSPLIEMTSDGSLSCYGREMRKVTWISRSGRLEGLIGLQEKLHGRVDKKCGLHVHVDARHLGKLGRLSAGDTYDRLVGLYPHLKKLVPQSRLKNKYCAWKENRHSGNRYCAINYCAYATHRTIEFRCQGASLNTQKIEMWALLCQHLVNWASGEHNAIPRTWNQFLAIVPEPMRTWCVLRREKLYGTPLVVNERMVASMRD